MVLCSLLQVYVLNLVQHRFTCGSQTYQGSLISTMSSWVHLKLQFSVFLKLYYSIFRARIYLVRYFNFVGVLNNYCAFCFNARNIKRLLAYWYRILVYIIIIGSCFWWRNSGISVLYNRVLYALAFGVITYYIK